MKIKKIIAAFILLSAFAYINAEEKTSLLESLSKVNWITKDFKSNVKIDIDKAGIPMPSGKMTAINTISTRMPDLVKNPILTLNVNSNKKLGDLILDQEITYQDIKKVISDSKSTMGYMEKDSSVFTTDNSVDLLKISSLFVRHNIPYRLQKPIEFVSSKAYTGIIIDARGSLPVHGEFIKDKAEPCFFPRIFSDEMDLIYEHNMVSPDIAKSKGVCFYDYSDDASRYEKIIGKDPVYILAQKTFGQNRSDIIIKKEDALKITCIPENLELLRQGKVVILLDKEQLVYDVSAPDKDKEYYTLLNKIKLYPVREFLGPDKIEDGPDGIRFLYNLKFIPNSPELLPEERSRISECAVLLKEALKDSSYSIFIGGHTADIGQPQNQMILSVQRTQTIIKALVAEGIRENLFTYRGYGATIPKGDNSTPEGRAVNRRVEITLRPKTVYIQRAN